MWIALRPFNKIPVESQTGFICKLAFYKNNKNIKYMDDQYKTQQMCNSAIYKYKPKTGKSTLLKYIPPEKQTTKMVNYVIKKKRDYRSFKYVARRYKNKSLCNYIVGRYGKAIRHVPSKHITQSLCQRAVLSDFGAFRYIPNKFKSKKICLYVLAYEPAYIFYLSDKMIEDYGIGLNLCEVVC